MQLQYFTKEEIKQGLDSIRDLKAPGIDGMPSLFYKKYWNIVDGDVIREVKQFLEGGQMPDAWNDMTIVLIPKV
jgi:hypothetical protein